MIAHAAPRACSRFAIAVYVAGLLFTLQVGCGRPSEPGPASETSVAVLLAEGDRLYDEWQRDMTRAEVEELPPNLAGVLAYLPMDNLEAAIDRYRQALELAPESPEVMLRLGRALREKGTVDGPSLRESVSLLHRARTLAPELVEVRVEEGLALRTTGEFDAAIGTLREAVRLDPDSVKARFVLAHTLVTQGSARPATGGLSKGIDQFQELVRRHPEYAEGHKQLIYALTYAKRYEEAWAHVHSIEAQGLKIDRAELLTLQDAMPEPESPSPLSP